MGTGKTAVGRILARRLEVPFVDTDEEIERSAGATIAELFRTRGEARFRELERTAIGRACDGAPAVVATGGGAVLDPGNRGRMRSVGRIVCLRASADAVLLRIGEAAGRPLLAGAPDPRTRIAELCEARAAAYADADWSIDTTDLGPDDVARSVVEWLRAS